MIHLELGFLYRYWVTLRLSRGVQNIPLDMFLRGETSCLISAAHDWLGLMIAFIYLRFARLCPFRRVRFGLVGRSEREERMSNP